MAKSMLEIAKDDKILQLVPMNGVGYCGFESPDKKCLGTMGLNGCTAVVLVSRKSAILGHFFPRPSEQKPDEATGDAHIKELMYKLRVVLNEHSDDFKYSPGSAGVMAYAVYSGIALESQKDIVEEQFRKWKLPLKSLPYTVLKDPRLGGPAKGTLLIDSRGETPNVYVEDQLVKIRNEKPRFKDYSVIDYRTIGCRIIKGVFQINPCTQRPVSTQFRDFAVMQVSKF